MTASAADPTTIEPSPTWRIAPSVPVATGVFIAYVVAFIGLMYSSGIDYPDIFASGENAFRAAVIPLLGGSLVLIAFVLWARWDFVFKDPDRLPMSGAMWVPVVIFSAAIIGHFAAVDWAKVDSTLILAVVCAGVLVGFAEETLFRGIILRSLRTNLRPEAWVMLISSLWFGFFHLTNLIVGSPISSVGVQVTSACVAGVILYLFRRTRGLLVTGMVAHALWDMSLFLPAGEGDFARLVGLVFLALVPIAGLVAAIVVLRRDRKITMTRTGLQTL